MTRDKAIDEQWRQVRGKLRDELGDTAFERWFESMSLVSANDSHVALAVPTRFLRDWVAPRYGDRLRALWRTVAGSTVSIEFVVKPVLANAEPQSEPATAGDEQANGEDGIGIRLDDRYSFDTFVVGKPNEFAYAAARNVAESDKIPYNPLFIYGGVGLGKSHLMHAIGLRFGMRWPDRRVLYISAEKFMYQFIYALRLDSIMSFKELIRSTDLLLVDDVQFMGGKDATQEEFFHTFNALIEQNKQIVVSGDRLPSDLEYMNERMRSRLGWGLVAEVHATSYELRLGILQAKTERAGYGSRVPPAVLEFLARKIATNVRDLEGALTRVVAHATMLEQEITLESCQETLKDMLRSADRHLTVEEIKKQTADYFGVRPSDLSSSRRAQRITRPRHVAMYLAKTLTSRSLPEIGRYFGNRDHTTVLHAIRRVEQLRRMDERFAEDVEILRRTLET